MHVYVRGSPEIMASPGLPVPEEPHQPLSFKFPKRLYGQILPILPLWKLKGYIKRMWAGECKSNLTTQVLVAPAL